MLFRFIHNLRRKPKAVRDNVALGAAGTFTALAVAGWLVLHNQVPLVGAAGELAEKSSAFYGLWGQIKEQTAAAIDSVPSKEDLETSIEMDSAGTEKTATSSVETSVSTSTSATTSVPVREIRIATTTSSTTE